MPRRRQGRRDFGTIYTDGTPSVPRFSVMWWEGRLRRRKRGFETRTEAEAHLARVRVELEYGTRQVGAPAIAEGVTVAHAIKAYGKHLLDKGCKPKTVADRLYRLNTFFPDGTAALADLTTSACAALYETLRAPRAVAEGKMMRTYSVDTHRNMLAEARMLAKWCVAKRWLRASPLEGVEGKGKRRHGKPQLRIDEARRWMAKAAELADAGEVGAVAAMMTLLLGMRAGEVVSRVVRDLDDEGRLLWIPDAKTEAGKRTLRVPEVLQPYLERLAAGQKPEALLLGHHWRDWPREWVQQICRAAAVPEVCAHSMRGLHSTLAMDAGITGAVVAAALGHEKVTTTVTSYASPDAVAGARQRRALTVLIGGAA